METEGPSSIRSTTPPASASAFKRPRWVLFLAIAIVGVAMIVLVAVLSGGDHGPGRHGGGMDGGVIAGLSATL